MKTRISEDSNYMGIWFDSGKTFRFPLDSNEEITELKYPEFYDIKITSRCQGKCPWCYQDSTPEGDIYENAYKNLIEFFNSIPSKNLPFQVAFGGGEPTEHPDFNDIIEHTFNRGVVPNFTTNGINISKWGNDKLAEHLDVVRRYCGGVAVSTHKHLKDYWIKAVNVYHQEGIRVNLHHIISDRKSILEMCDYVEQFEEKIDYIVLLPWSSQVGRAQHKTVDTEALSELFPWKYLKKIAWGANFYDYIQTEEKIKKFVMIYPPEMFSKYIDLGGTGAKFASSFSNIPLETEMFSSN